MNRFTYTGSLLAVAVGGFGGAANAQDSCEQQVQQLEQQVQQRQLDSQTQQQVEDLLSNAEAAGGQECQSIVMEVRQQLEGGDSQQAQVVRTAPEDQQSSQRAQSQSQQQQSAEQQQTARAQGGEERTEVEVQQRAADVDVETPAPTVRVQQPEPQVTVQQPEPEVTITQPEPEVTVNQAEPEVQVSQAEPQVEVQQGEPQVEVQQAESADVQVVTEDEQQGQQRSQVAQTEQQSQQTGGSITEDQASQLIGQSVHTRDGEDVGEISGVARSLADQQLHGLVDVGGFLGIGERTVSIPLDRAQVDQEGNLVTQMSRQEIEGMEEYDPTQYASIEEEDQRILR